MGKEGKNTRPQKQTEEGPGWSATQPVWQPHAKLMDKAIDLTVKAEAASDALWEDGPELKQRSENTKEDHLGCAQLHIEAALANRVVVSAMYDNVKGWKPQDTLGWDQQVDTHLDEARYQRWLAEGNTGTMPYTRIWQDDPEQQ